MIDPQTMRDTLRYWASGVSVVSTVLTQDDAQLRSGMTVSAFNSLSLEPPLVLVCLHKEAHTARMVMESGCFAISILGAEQSELSDRFAGRIPGLDGDNRFHDLATFTAQTGAPILRDALAWLDCTIHTTHDGSTHWIVIGLVQAAGRGLASEPLLYFDRSYRQLAALKVT
jgi:flavin reductase (DIM6/NTAB) family NADH-FMN oxidoreductase RutF